MRFLSYPIFRTQFLPSLSEIRNISIHSLEFLKHLSKRKMPKKNPNLCESHRLVLTLQSKLYISVYEFNFLLNFRFHNKKEEIYNIQRYEKSSQFISLLLSKIDLVCTHCQTQYIRIHTHTNTRPHVHALTQ